MKAYLSSILIASVFSTCLLATSDLLARGSSHSNNDRGNDSSWHDKADKMHDSTTRSNRGNSPNSGNSQSHGHLGIGR